MWLVLKLIFQEKHFTSLWFPAVLVYTGLDHFICVFSMYVHTHAYAKCGTAGALCSC